MVYADNNHYVEGLRSQSNRNFWHRAEQTAREIVDFNNILLCTVYNIKKVKDADVATSAS